MALISPRRKVTEAKIKNDILPVFLPTGITDTGQHVDNNNGKTIKHDLRGICQEYLNNFDWEKNPTGKLSAKEKRKLMAEFVNRVAREYDTKHQGLVASTALQCGMSLAIDGSNVSGVKPALCAL
jgi:hypothetical protein